MKMLDCLNLNTALQKIASDDAKKPIKFAYAVARNIHVLSPVVTAYQETLKKAEWFPTVEAFEKDRMQLIEKLAQRDENGNIKTNGQNVLLESPQEFQKEFSDLLANHPNIQEAQKHMQQQEQELMNQEEDITLYKLPITEFPTEIEIVGLQALLPMVSE